MSAAKKDFAFFYMYKNAPKNPFVISIGVFSFKVHQHQTSDEQKRSIARCGILLIAVIRGMLNTMLLSIWKVALVCEFDHVICSQFVMANENLACNRSHKYAAVTHRLCRFNGIAYIVQPQQIEKQLFLHTMCSACWYFRYI